MCELKKCSRCGEQKPNNKGFFAQRSNICRDCKNAHIDNLRFQAKLKKERDTINFSDEIPPTQEQIIAELKAKHPILFGLKKQSFDEVLEFYKPK